MNKKIIILGLIVAILALIVIISYFKFAAVEKKGSSLPIPVYKPSSSPAVSLPELTLLNITPLENISIQYSPTQQIKLTFDDSVLPDQLILKISPDTKVSVTRKISEPKTLLINPTSSWNEGFTTLIILIGTKSQRGSFLNKEIIYKINTGLPDYANFYE